MKPNNYSKLNYSIQFIKSAVHPEDYPKDNINSEIPEVAIVGRSNAGKSSFINALSGSKIAKVSQVPGKTRLINFFNCGTKYRLVDLPGYGFAARDMKEMKMWQKMIETYLASRKQLAAVILVMDVRRIWDEEEILIKDFLQEAGRPLVVGLNKIDKISKSEALKKLKEIKEASHCENVFLMSSTKKLGVKELEATVFNEFVLPTL
jgi:GTP-binding protein